MRVISVAGGLAILGVLSLPVTGAWAQQQPDVTRPAGAPRGASQPPAPAQQEDLTRILEQLRAQSQAIDARVRSLEQTIERQNQEIERLQSGQAAPSGTTETAGDSSSGDSVAKADAATADTPAPAPTGDASQESKAAVPANAPTIDRNHDPFASPSDFMLELRSRYSDRFGGSAPPQPRMGSDYDDHSLAMKRWTVGQNRILSQPVEWKVRVLRVTASSTNRGGAVLLCAVDNPSEDGIDHTFEVDATADIVSSMPAMEGSSVYTLVGIMDPRLAFSPEHERDDRWDRSGHVIGPFCVSDWRIQGLQLRPVSE